MTDSELLELAAKAAGYKRMKYREDTPYVSLSEHGNDFWVAWNPLTDDGDALWLAVKLGLLMDADSQCAMQQGRHGDQMDDWCNGEPDDDACARMRRAIVRAAAAIGETK